MLCGVRGPTAPHREAGLHPPLRPQGGIPHDHVAWLGLWFLGLRRPKKKSMKQEARCSHGGRTVLSPGAPAPEPHQEPVGRR